MAITSSDIQNQSFSIDRKGYDVDEVDVFLERVANEIDDMNATIEQLENELDGDKFSGFETQAIAAKADTGVSSEELAKKDAYIADLEQQLEEKKANDYAIAQALIIAQRSSDEILGNARADADQIRRDAEDEAQRIIDRANKEKQGIIDDIEKLEDDREDARSEYQEILKDFISDATKKLSDLGSTGISSSAHAKSPSGDRVMPKNQSPIRSAVSATSSSAYATPQSTGPAVVVPTTPRPSKVEKDLSGFGDADDAFEFEEID